jgi:hypothetical protein
MLTAIATAAVVTKLMHHRMTRGAINKIVLPEERLMPKYIKTISMDEENKVCEAVVLMVNP